MRSAVEASTTQPGFAKVWLMTNARPLHEFIAAGVFAAAFAWNAPARAEISASPKGLVGGALLGAELTVIGEVIVGVETEWLYLAGAGAGAVAGGIGGYFVDDANSPGLSMAFLVGGMALAIPALVLGLNATRQHWPEPVERRLPSEPTSNPPDPNAGPELTLHLLPTGGRKLLRWRAAEGVAFERTFRWSVPDVYVAEAFSPADRQRFSLPVATQIQVPVFTATW